MKDEDKPISENENFYNDKKIMDSNTQLTSESTASVNVSEETRNNVMDVHRHSGSHAGKKFKDYLFEFFMLFLAVSAGFWVENLREYYVERHRERQYVASMIRDLASDTSSMREVIETTNAKIRGIDTLIGILDNPDNPSFVSDVYYYSFRYMYSAEYFSHTDGTITQLKNAGGLRLMRQSASDSITSYYSSAENVKWNSDFSLGQFKTVMDIEKQIFDFKTLRKKRFAPVLRRQGTDNTIGFMSRDPVL